MNGARIACLALGTLTACASRPCESVTTDRAAIVGSVVYRPPSTKTSFVMSHASIWSVGRSSLEVDVDLASDTDGERSMRLSLSGLVQGPPQPLAGGTLGHACLVLQAGAAPTCLPLAGTIEVRRLEADCVHHESGISLCAENVDVALHASSDEHGISMRIDLDIVRLQHWSETACSGDGDGFL